jgi:hypothetical protein
MTLRDSSARRALLCGLLTLAACAESAEPEPDPTQEEIAGVVEGTCAIGIGCGSVGEGEDEAEMIEACEMGSELWTLLTPEGNPNCADVWLVYEYYNCESSLGCDDYLFTSAEDPGSPCHEELMAAYDANCDL